MAVTTLAWHRQPHTLDTIEQAERDRYDARRPAEDRAHTALIAEADALYRQVGTRMFLTSDVSKRAHWSDADNCNGVSAPAADLAWVMGALAQVARKERSAVEALATWTMRSKATGER